MGQLQQLDYELAMSRVGGDAELLKELAELFLEEYPKLIAELHQSHQQGNAKGVESSAHGLKGSVANFGAKPVVDVALLIEQSGRSGDLSGVGGLLPTLDLALLALHGELASL